MPHSGRGVSRARRTNMQFSTGGGISSLSPSSRDAVVDPIAELLSQLSGVRRGAGQPGTPSQLQQLQMQLQLERQQATFNHRQAARQQLERLPRRAGGATGGASGSAPPPAPQPAVAQPQPQPEPSDSQFLLSGFLGASDSQAGPEAESRAALLRGLVLASLGRAAPAWRPPPPAAPPAPAAPRAPAPPPTPLAVAARVKPAARSKVACRGEAEAERV
ncbi:unnamed protein product [Spodoptera exigua]|nr:unnamed protein product [Spodoptera exigua]